MVTAGVEQGLHVGVGPGRLAGTDRRTERGDLRVAQLLAADLVEEGRVTGIGSRPAAFDHGYAELVEAARDGEFVVDRVVDALALGAVAQRGVVDLDAARNLPRLARFGGSGGTLVLRGRFLLTRFR
jgi:hypothetical protein